MARNTAKQVSDVNDDAVTGNSMDAENAAPSGENVEQAASGAGDTVFVFANLPSAQSFRLPDGEHLTVAGMPVSRLKGLDGRNLAGGRYGVTEVPADAWAEVKKTYGAMRIFQSGLVFDAPTLERGKAMARERGGLRHGCEQVDPISDRRTKTRPKTDD